MIAPLTTEEQQRSVVTLSVIGEISELLVKTQSTTELLQQVLLSFERHFGVQHGYLLIPVENEQLQVVAGLGAAQQHVGRQIPLGLGIAGVAAQRKRTVRIGNMRVNRRYMRSLMTSKVDATPTSQIVELPGLTDSDSQLAIPLMVGEQLAVVFVAESTEPVVFSEEDGEIFSLLVSQIAAAVLTSQRGEALERAREEEERLRQESQRALEALNARTRSLGRRSLHARRTWRCCASCATSLTSR